MALNSKAYAIRQGKTIRKHRYLNEMTQQNLADKIGIPRSVLSYIENGRVAATDQTLVEIARALGIFITDLDIPEEPDDREQ